MGGGGGGGGRRLPYEKVGDARTAQGSRSRRLVSPTLIGLKLSVGVASMKNRFPLPGKLLVFLWKGAAL